MSIFDLTALRAAFRFVLENPRLIVIGAVAYGIVFSVQSLFTAYAGANAPGAAPAMLMAGILAFGVFVVVAAGFLRAALEQEPSGALGFTLGKDEMRLGWALILVLILLLIILLTAGVAMAFMIAGLAFTNMDPEAPQPEGYVNMFDMMGPGALAVSLALIAVFLVFSAWLVTRLMMAAPATIAAGAIKVLSVWPLSSKKSFEIALTGLVAMVPGVLLLFGLNAVSQALIGAGPALAQSASGDAGVLTQPVWVLMPIYWLYGVIKIMGLAAPGLALMCALFVKYSSQLPSEAS